MDALGPQRSLAGVSAPRSPPVARPEHAPARPPLLAQVLADGGPMVNTFDREADRHSFAATRASHGSQGDRSSDTSNTGSGETVLADAPRERFASRAFGPGAHRREETTRVTAEGRLADVRIRVEWSPGTPIAQIVLTGEAMCHGKTIRCSDRGWRSRPVEASRRLMRELLATVRLAVEAAVVRAGASAFSGGAKEARVACGDDAMSTASDSGDPSDGEAGADADGAWDNCRRALDCIDGESPTAPAESSECDEAPGVRIVDIEWANRLRWGGDAMYDPAVDGPISLQGACTLDDPSSRAPRRERPVWAAYDRHTPATPATPSPPRRTWRDLPREAILEAVVRELGPLSNAVSANSWSIDRRVYPGTKRTCDDVADSEEQTFETVFGFRARTALVRIHGHAPPPGGECAAAAE